MAFLSLMILDNRKLKQLVLFALFATIFLLGFIQSEGNANVLLAHTAINLTMCFLLVQARNINGAILLTWGALVLLFVSSLAVSVFPIRSLATVVVIANSFIFFLVVYTNLPSTKVLPREQLLLSSTTGVSEPVDFVQTALLAAVCVTAIHAISQLSQYMTFPTRTTGMLKDYSQASMVILLTYGLAYFHIRDTKYASPLTFLLFLGFFTTFSRSANFLLVIFLSVIIFLEFGKDSLRRTIELIVTIGFAALLVYMFPVLVGLETVDRGGFAHVSTLNSRTHYWSTAWQAILQKPVFGHGLQTFEFTGIKSIKPDTQISHIHNDYLQIWHDLGIIWFVVFVVIIVSTICRFAPFESRLNPLKILREARKKPPTVVLCWSLLCIVAAYMTINFLILSSLFQLLIALILLSLIREQRYQNRG